MENLLKITGRMTVYVLPVLIYVRVIFLKILTQTKLQNTVTTDNNWATKSVC
jgi:hypothetical protein